MGNRTKQAFELIGSVAKKAVELPVRGAFAIAKALVKDEESENGQAGRQRPAERSKTDRSRSSSANRSSHGASTEATSHRAAEPTETDEASDEASDAELVDIWGVGDARAEDLVEAGFESVRDVAEASTEDLTELSGIGSSTAEKMKESARDLLD